MVLVRQGEGQGRRVAAAVISMMILGLAVACGGGEVSSPDGSTPATGPDASVVPTTVLPSEATTVPPTPTVLAVGESAVAGELEIVVRSTSRAGAINNGIQRGSFVLVDVGVRNIGQTDQRYGPLDWRVETADGTILEPEVYADAQKLTFGTLSGGADAAGALAFEVGDQQVVAIRYRQQGSTGPTIEWAVTPTDLGDA